MTKAWQQGRFDGLCGIYSLINSVHALHHGFGEDDCGKLFEFLIKAGGPVFPAALYQGLAHEQLWGIANQMNDHLKGTMTLKFARPYFRHPADSIDTYFNELGLAFEGRKMVALVGLGAPWFHWSVIKDVKPKSIAFADSYGIKTRKRTALSFDEGDDVIKIDYHQTILIERV